VGAVGAHARLAHLEGALNTELKHVGPEQGKDAVFVFPKRGIKPLDRAHIPAMTSRVTPRARHDAHL